MGIPITTFINDSQSLSTQTSNKEEKFPLLTHEIKQKVYSCFLDSPMSSNLNTFEHTQSTPNYNNFTNNWRLQCLNHGRLDAELGDLQYKACFNNEGYMLYNRILNKISIMHDSTDTIFEVDLLDFQYLISGNLICDIDTFFDEDISDDPFFHLVLTLNADRRKYLILTCNSNIQLMNYYLVNLRKYNYENMAIIKMWPFLLPKFLLLFDAINGILITDITSNITYRVPLPAELQDFQTTNFSDWKIQLSFPELAISKGNKIWNANDLLIFNDFMEFDITPLLKNQECIENIIIPQATDFLLVETNQRMISLYLNDLNPTSLQFSNIFQKTAEMTRNFISRNGQTILVIEKNMYSLSLSIYTYNDFSKQWLYLGYNDLISELNTYQIKDAHFHENDSINENDNLDQSVIGYITIFVSTENISYHKFDIKKLPSIR